MSAATLNMTYCMWCVHACTSVCWCVVHPRARAHTHKHRGWFNSVALCWLPYLRGCWRNWKDCGWVLCLLIGWWQTNPSITEIHKKKKKKGKRDRGRSPGGWVAQTPVEVSSPFSSLHLILCVCSFLLLCCFVDISLLFFFFFIPE